MLQCQTSTQQVWTGANTSSKSRQCHVHGQKYKQDRNAPTLTWSHGRRPATMSMHTGPRSRAYHSHGTCRVRRCATYTGLDQRGLHHAYVMRVIYAAASVARGPGGDCSSCRCLMEPAALGDDLFASPESSSALAFLKRVRQVY